MIANGGNGSGSEARSGARALTLLAAPPIATMLRRLGDGPQQLVDLRREAGSPPQTTMRAHLKELYEIGVVAKRRRDRFPGVLEYALEPAGSDLLFVVDVLERWLAAAPEEPLELGSGAAKAAIKALTEGWTSTMLRALAARPLSLTELDRVIGALTYPSLERRLTALRLAGLVTARPAEGARTPYGVTPWLRRGIAPILAATRWERRHLGEQAPPIARIDTEAAFLLALPLLELPEELSGICRLGVEMRNGSGERALSGALAEVRDGRFASCSVQLNGDVDAWATGNLSAWLQALLDADLDHLELGGNQRLAHAVLAGLNSVLSGAEKIKA